MRVQRNYIKLISFYQFLYFEQNFLCGWPHILLFENFVEILDGNTQYDSAREDIGRCKQHPKKILEVSRMSS